MKILNFKTMKTIKILGYFKELCEVDKLKLAINLLESPYLHLDIDKEKEISKFQKRLSEWGYETIFNYNENKYLVYLSAMFMELSEYDKDVFVIDMLDNIYKTIVIP